MIHKTTRSILSVLLAALLLVTSIPLTPAFADGGAVSPQSESGEGRALEQVDGVYQIYTADDLKEFADIVNGIADTPADKDANAKLMNDIDLNGSEENPWTPIGNIIDEEDPDSFGYTGTFNGDGHTISGLYIDSSSANYQGLFGYVGTGGTVKDLSVSGTVSGGMYVGGVVGYNGGTVTGCIFSGSGSVSGGGYVGGVVGENSGSVINCTNTNTGTVSGNSVNSNVGGVVGYNSGTVKNCYNTGNISGRNQVGGVVGQNSGGVVGLNSSGIVTNCYNIGEVSGNQVGGVVGDNGGTVKNCYNTGNINGSGMYVGGVVGHNRGSVENCYNTGSVSGNRYVGGVVGWNISSGNVTNCYNTGSVKGSGYWSSGNWVGGVVGDNRGTVENCYNTGTVSSNSNTSDVGGVVGQNFGRVTGCYFLQENDVPANGIGGGETDGQTATSVTTLGELCDALEDSNTWTTSPFCEHPVLQENPEGGLGTATHPYEIKTIDQLKTFRYLVNNGIEKSAHAKLMNDIDLKGSETNKWTPIGSFSNSYEGTFDGNGKTISGLYINNSIADYQGLFGRVNGGTVQDLTVSGSVKGDDYVGGVVGYNYSGIVTGCIFSGSGSVSGVTGSDYVGGVVGDNGSSASVENCYNTGSVNGSADSSSVGGVVGDNSGTVKNCYNTDAVSGSGWYVGGVVGSNSGTVENCYNTDKVSGNRSVGGVVGDNGSSASVENCYNTGSVSGVTGSDYVGGVVGQNFGSGSVTNCYFLKTDDVNKNLPGIGEGSGSATGKNDTAFHSGEVAWLLQNGQTAGSSQVWGQSNLKDKNSWPTLGALDKDAKPVYKVAFISDDTEIEAQYANSGMTVDLPEAPKKTNHLFGGWFNNGELTGDPVTGPISVTANATYTAKWTPFSYTLSATPSALNFGSITEGEERPAAQNVTITNTGNQAVTLNPPTAENFEIGALSKTELAPNTTATFTIQPKDNLSRGSYSEQIVVSNTNGEKAAITATFTVKEPPYTGKYSYELTTSVGDHGSLTVDRYATEGEKVTITVTPDEAYKLDDLSVTAHGKDVELTANGDGTFSFTMPSADVKISATFAEDPDWTEPEPEPSTDVSDLFIDIAPDAWYKDAVQYAYDNGLMTGVSDTEFAPEATTTTGTPPL